MKHRLLFGSLPLMALFLTLAPVAMASNTWYVDGVNGNDDNNCKSPQTACKTIGHAISLASSGDAIKVAPATYTENLTISISLKILGADASTTIVDGNEAGTVVTISSSSAVVALSELTIQNGSAQYGGGINNSGTLTVKDTTITSNTAYFVCTDDCEGGGGGIYNGGTLTVKNTTITSNTANFGCTAGCGDLGGGIFNSGTLTVNKSTIGGNSVSGFCGKPGCGALGGGIFNWGTLTVNNATINGNSATCRGYCENWGGGVSNGIPYHNGTLAINNSTISGNSAAQGGGIYNNDGAVVLQNSIVANSTSGGNCWGTMTSNGYNLSDDNSCNFGGTGDYNDTKPELGKLGYHGGPTQTIPELKGSITVDHGNPSGCTDSQGHLLTTDQRGYPRPGAHKTHKICDMGAYERQTD